MDREHVKGAADKAKGATREPLGKLQGTRSCRPKASSIRRQALLRRGRCERRFAQCIKGRLIYKSF